MKKGWDGGGAQRQISRGAVSESAVRPRYLFLGAAGVALLLGLVAGLERLGIVGLLGPMEHTRAASLAQDHGPLMVFGFVGGAIGLERAVAAKARWAWMGPIAHVGGVVTLIVGLPTLMPAALFAASFVVLGAIYAVIYRRQPTLAIAVQATGVIGGVCASLLWAQRPDFADAMPLAVVYVVATIIGERIELARLKVAGTHSEVMLAGLVFALCASGILSMAAPAIGHAAMGVCLVLLAVTSVRVDVAANLVRSTGLPRYSAVCMLAGYFWLALGGFTWVASGRLDDTTYYDTTVHTIFLGFVMSMIFAHAPIILTSVLHRSLPYRPVLLVPVALLHGGLAVRVVGGLNEAQGVYVTGAVITFVAVLVFVTAGVSLTVANAKASRGRRRG